mmetsp:Transcript_93658/g.291874  ORF Transcript_93658/g.291874 Transcript_93658/m.291874 type:complete len:215 (-) Transcript_93658:84-728(-)
MHATASTTATSICQSTTHPGKGSMRRSSWPQPSNPSPPPIAIPAAPPPNPPGPPGPRRASQGGGTSWSSRGGSSCRASSTFATAAGRARALCPRRRLPPPHGALRNQCGGRGLPTPEGAGPEASRAAAASESAHRAQAMRKRIHSSGMPTVRCRRWQAPRLMLPRLSHSPCRMLDCKSRLRPGQGLPRGGLRRGRPRPASRSPLRLPRHMRVWA